MGIASLVLGIISIVIGLIPFCGMIAIVPAIIGIILGIVDVVKKSKEEKAKGVSIAGIVLSAFAVIFIIFWVFVLASDTTTTNTINNSVTNSTINESESLNKNKENSTTKTEKKESYSVGEVFNDGYMKVTYTSLNDNFTDYSKYATINDGCKIVCATFEFENISSSNQLASSYRFNCYADGYDCDNFYSVDDATFSSSLSTGKKAKGSVYFQVPVDADEVVIEYQSNILSNKTAKFIVK